MCESQVQVTSGASPNASALAGNLPKEDAGELADAPTDDAGLVAQPTELDWVPAPHLTHITSQDESLLAVGPGPSIDLYLNSTRLAAKALVKPVTAQTAGSPDTGNLTIDTPAPSNALSVTYAVVRHRRHDGDRARHRLQPSQLGQPL